MFSRSLVDIYNGQTETLVYDYDAINRLKAVSNALSESYTYDARGNLEIKGGQTLAYNNPAHKHAVTSYNGNTYAYDANGNMTTRVVNGVTTTLTYDGENRLVGASWQNHSAQFVYDGDGRRVQVIYKTGGNVDTNVVYVGNFYEKSLAGAQVVTKYYRAGGALVGMLEGATLTYLFTDHLGSTTVSLTGGTATYQRYLPWGEVRGGGNALPTDNTYTGQKTDEPLGLMFYNARWYDPMLGRFAQADSLIPQPGNPLAWDRFAYSGNNPINYNDPTGHWVETAFDIISLGMTINDIRNEGFTFWNIVSLVTDAASVVLPIVPAGISHTIRAYKTTDKLLDTAKNLNDASNLVQIANKSDTVIDIVKKADNLPEDEILYQFSRRPGENGKMRGFPDSLRSGEEGMSCQIGSICGYDPAMGF